MEHDHADLVSRPEAVSRIQSIRQAFFERHVTEQVRPGDGIRGRVLARNIEATQDIPRWDHATMDGFAVSAPVESSLEIVDEVFPEDDPPVLDSGEAVRIATGAPLPDRANAVIRSEDAAVEDGKLAGPPIDPGTYTYKQGSNVEAGETLFARTETLGAKDAILLANLGIDAVEVYAPPTVGVLATGSEIHDDPSTDYDSKMLLELLRAWGARPAYEGTVPDTYDRVRDQIVELAGSYDVVVTTGGTSVGAKDHVIRALAELGEIDFHRVRIRPGKPLAVARLDEAIAFAVPGKPFGAYTIATLVMRPFFTGSTSLPSVDATTSVGLGVGDPGFEYAIPVSLEDGAAVPLGHRSSALQIYEDTFDPSVLSSTTRASRADGTVLTEAGFEAGETITVIPYDALE